MAPSLSEECLGAVHIPGEILVDPWLHAGALAAHARQNGAQIFTGFEWDAKLSRFDQHKRIWTIAKKEPSNETP